MANKNWKYGLSHKTILQDYNGQIELNDSDFCILFKFYVLNAPYPNQSNLGLSFRDYGWEGSILSNGLGQQLDEAISEKRGPFFLPARDNGVRLSQMFQQAHLNDGAIGDLDRERAAITINTSRQNQFVRLFRHIRNCLAHGRFVLVATQDNPSGIFILEDRDQHNITARIIFRKQTLLDWANIIKAGPSPR